MDIHERAPGDIDRLQSLIRREKDAEQRDRYRVVVLAVTRTRTQDIQNQLHRSRGFVQRWAYAYRDGGIDAIAIGKPPGQPPKLTPAQQQGFKQRITAEPTEADGGVCTLRGKDAVRILKEEFGKSYTLSGAYALMHRLNLSCLRPRPTHRKNDPQAMAAWQTQAPLLSRA